MYLAAAILFLLGAATLPVGSLMLLVVAVALLAGGYTLGRGAGGGEASTFIDRRHRWPEIDPPGDVVIPDRHHPLASIGGPRGPELPDGGRS